MDSSSTLKSEKEALVESGGVPPETPESEVATETPQEQEEGRLVRAERSEFFSGPIPPPEILVQYNSVIPNGADRILAMAEQQQAHRQHLEKTVVESDIRRSERGLTLGFIITLLFGIGGIYLVANGHSLNGLAVIFGPLAVLVGTFIYAQSTRKRERLEKSETATEQTQN